MSKPISQREARRLLKHNRELVTTLANQRRTYGQEWPDGQVLMNVSIDETLDKEEIATVQTAQRFGHPVLVRVTNTTLHFYGMK